MSSSIDAPFTVRFFNDTELLETDLVKKGGDAVYQGTEPTKQKDIQYHYTFSGWDKALTNILKDTDFYAQFDSEVNTYAIRFLNDGGEELYTYQAKYGTTPIYQGDTPAKEADAQYSYSFSGWTPAFVPVTGNADYTAVYANTIRSYTVNFVNDDSAHTVLQSSKWNYGETPTYTSDTPTKEQSAEFTFAFKGWSPEITAVTGETTYTASYTETTRSYTINFVNWDGTSLYSGHFYYGGTPNYPLTYKTPVRKSDAQYTSYTFSGWTPTIVPVVGDATYTAVFEGSGLKSYTVTFENDSATTIYETQTVAYGSYPTFPATNPTKTSSNPDLERDEFTGWSPSTPQMVTGDQVYKAVFTIVIISHVLTFKNWDGTVLYSESQLGGTLVNDVITNGGINPTRPEDRVYQSYTFTGWSPAITSTTKLLADATYTAQYTGNNSKTYTMVLDGTHNHVSSYTLPSSDYSTYTATSATYAAGSTTAGTDSLSEKVTFYLGSGFTFQDTNNTFITLTASSTAKTTKSWAIYFLFNSTSLTKLSLTYRFQNNSLSSPGYYLDKFKSNIWAFVKQDLTGYMLNGSGESIQSCPTDYSNTVTVTSATDSNMLNTRALKFTLTATFTGTLTLSIPTATFSFTYDS